MILLEFAEDGRMDHSLRGDDGVSLQEGIDGVYEQKSHVDKT